MNTPLTPEQLAAFDAKLAAAYASQTVRELNEAAEIAAREDRWVSLYRALLA